MLHIQHYHKNYSSPLQDSYRLAILCKQFTKLEEVIIHPLVLRGVHKDDIIAIRLPYNDEGIATATHMTEHIPELQKEIDRLKITTLIILDIKYFKRFTKMTKVANTSGIGFPSQYSTQACFKGISPQALRYSDKNLEKNHRVLRGVYAHLSTGSIEAPNILKDVSYPGTLEDIKQALDRLLSFTILACDIEGFGLALNTSLLGTIAFATSKTDGIAFSIDYRIQGSIDICRERRELLKQFFITYSKQGGKLIYHGSTFDVKQLVFNLFMRNDLGDSINLVDGTEIMASMSHCTYISSYLSTNSVEGNELSLKAQASPYLGVYAIDLSSKSILDYPVSEVLTYNLYDAVGTYWLHQLNMERMEAREQLELYAMLMEDSHTLIEMELHGTPIDMDEVLALYNSMNPTIDNAYSLLMDTDAVKDYLVHASKVNYKKWQDSVVNPDKRSFDEYTAWKPPEFKAGSPAQLSYVLFTYYGFPILERTKTGNASTGAKTVKKLLNYCKGNDDETTFITALLEWQKVVKILDFIKSFIKYCEPIGDGNYRLYGNFRLGGTISGRLSSNSPNLTNLPSGGDWGKAIKNCFRSPNGEMWSDSDFNSLEAMTAALQSKDKNMLGVYEHGYDSHCLATYAYADGNEDWYTTVDDAVKKAEANNSIPERVLAINLIKKIGNDSRKASKGRTFAFTYFGDHRTVMSNFGTDEYTAKRQHNAFLSLYPDYFKYVDDKLKAGAKQGFILLFFNLRLDLPALSKCKNWDKMTSIESAEYRSAGNAIGQSTGMLNTFAGTNFRKLIRASKHRYDIFIMMFIHDAIYTTSKATPEILKYINDNLIECMHWQDEYRIRHDTVKLGAELELRPESWASCVPIDNNVSIELIERVLKENIV